MSARRWRRLDPIFRHVGNTFSGVLELALPPSCTACGCLTTDGAAFCPTCSASLEPIRAACARCGLPLPLAEGSIARGPCPACLRCPPSWQSFAAPYVFGAALASAIRRWKLTSQPHLTPALAGLMAPTLLLAADEVDLWLPVPLHPHRLRAREFNQSSLLLRSAAAKLRPTRRLIVRELLDRVRDTPPQATLDAAARRRNLRGAFRVAKRASVAGLRLGLVDDVVTTGATAAACSEALLAGGAASVHVAALARAVQAA